MARHSAEYTAYIKSPLWRFWRRICLGLFLGRDIVCPLLPATQAHHLHYKMMGFDLPLLSIVPLNANVHQLIHLPILWRNKQMRFVVNLGLRSLCCFWLYWEWQLVSLLWETVVW
ncbi:MAG: hypothetical protein RBJ76_13495 [Stenomitos frigidus ULC029]